MGEIKAEEICYYSNPDQFRDCAKKSKLKTSPKYPLSTWSGPSDLKIRNFPFYGWNIGNIYKTIEFESKTPNDIKITLRDERYGVFGLKRLSEKSILINSSDIISWDSKWDSASGTGMFDLNYVDNYGVAKNIKFQKLFKRRFADMQETYFKEITRLGAGEKNSIKNILNSKLRRNEKKLSVIKRIILIEEDNTKNCLNLNEVKFPGLTTEFKKLSKTINPLREKVDLPQLSQFNKICGDISGVRPQWMEEKIKGCNKYPTKKQRDYCINVYSPYGQE